MGGVEIRNLLISTVRCHPVQYDIDTVQGNHVCYKFLASNLHQCTSCCMTRNITLISEQMIYKSKQRIKSHELMFCSINEDIIFLPFSLSFELVLPKYKKIELLGEKPTNDQAGKMTDSSKKSAAEKTDPLALTAV